MTSHIITIDVDRAIDVVCETIRKQISTMRPQTTIDRSTTGVDAMGAFDGQGTLALAVVDARDGSLDRRLDDEEIMRTLNNIARNIVQSLCALEVPQPHDLERREACDVLHATRRLIREYVDARDEFDAVNISDPRAKDLGLRASNLSDALRREVSNVDVDVKPKRVSLDEIKWDDAGKSATMLAKLCRDVGFVAPEGWQTQLHDAAGLMNNIRDALHLTAPAGPRDVATSSSMPDGWAVHVRDLTEFVARHDWRRAMWVMTTLMRQAISEVPQ